MVADLHIHSPVSGNKNAPMTGRSVNKQ